MLMEFSYSIVRMGVGYDHLDRVALASRGVTLCNVPGATKPSPHPHLPKSWYMCNNHTLTSVSIDYGTAEIADHALALTLSLRRGIILHNDRQRGPQPAPWMYIDTPLIARIQNNTFGILGLGRIGTATALRAKAFGWNVLFYDPYKSNGTDKSLGIERTKNITEFFQRSTTLSIHCPCTRETRGMIDYDLLKLLPRGAVLVNTARGEVVNLDGVERCLREGIISGVGLDVLPREPIPESPHPLITAYRNREEWLTGSMHTVKPI
jgi:C-terminal binding protein